MTSRAPAEPVKLTVSAAEGKLLGSNGRYERVLSELAGLYQDGDAFENALTADQGTPVYWVEDSRMDGSSGELITGLSVLRPGRIGDEFYMTRGHIHQCADRAELYLCVSGRGVMVLEHIDGENRVIEIGVGEAVQVPGFWVHRSVNVGDEVFATVFSYAADAGQDYSIIEEAGGMKQLVVADGDGWSVIFNPNHTGYRHV